MELSGDTVGANARNPRHLSIVDGGSNGASEIVGAKNTDSVLLRSGTIHSASAVICTLSNAIQTLFGVSCVFFGLPISGSWGQVGRVSALPERKRRPTHGIVRALRSAVFCFCGAWT